MHFLSTALLVAFALFSIPSAAQEPTTRDPRAVVLLQQSLLAMGGLVPSDSVASGTIVIVAGSKTETGTVRILTRGFEQSVEEIQTSDAHVKVVYSRGLASETERTAAKVLPLELAVTSQCPDFPLPLVAGALSKLDIGVQYVGLETLNGFPAHRVRLWSTFPPKAGLEHLAEFSRKDLWIDAASGLPRKLSYHRRAGAGAEPGIPVELFYLEYRNVSGVLYPFRIEKSFNGTPWMTIAIGTVNFNAGLTDADFPVPKGGLR